MAVIICITYFFVYTNTTQMSELLRPKSNITRMIYMICDYHPYQYSGTKVHKKIHTEKVLEAYGNTLTATLNSTSGCLLS